jgi:hypothetical protein
LPFHGGMRGKVVSDGLMRSLWLVSSREAAVSLERVVLLGGFGLWLVGALGVVVLAVMAGQSSLGGLALGHAGVAGFCLWTTYREPDCPMCCGRPRGPVHF